VMLDLLNEDLRSQPPNVESARAQASSAEAQVQRLASLAADLLDLSRIDAGLPLRTELVEVGAIVRSVAGELVARPGAAIDLADNGAVWAVGDPGSVAQIVRILIDNALVHGASDQPVHVHAELGDGMARVVVEDHGPGIARDERGRVFERFERGVDASEGGFGLGLAIGRELARRMDGDLTLEGDPPGARFVLSLSGAPSP